MYDDIKMVHKHYKNEAWKRQRILKKQDIPNQDHIYDLACSFTDEKQKALFILCYLTGGRITEIVGRKHKVVRHYLKEQVYDKDGNLKTQVCRNENGSPISLNYDKVDDYYPGILKSNITFENKRGKNLMIISMQNRKNPKFFRKIIPVPIDKETRFVNDLKRYLNTLGDEEPLFDFGKRTAERYIEMVGMNPHFLRDIRLTHLVTIYGFGAFQLVRFAGWKNATPAERYIRLSLDDMIDKF